ASAGSASTGRLSPSRSAFFATAALPAGVRGPVLRAALARLAMRTAALVMPCLHAFVASDPAPAARRSSRRALSAVRAVLVSHARMERNKNDAWKLHSCI